MKRFDKIRATFNPKVTDDLVPGMENHTGKRFTFEAMWKIDREAYIGQWAMYTSQLLGMCVPLCDLDNIEGVI